MSSEEEQAEAPPETKKKSGLMMKLVLVLVLLAVGGGGVFGLMAAGIIGGEHEEPGDNLPKLVMKGDSDPYGAASESSDGGPEFVYGESGSKYRTAYFSFSDDFITNLRGSEGLIQVTLAASTQRDGRVLMWLEKHELAIRSQLLIDLADTPEEDVITPEGKARLQQRMIASINRILTETEGFGGVDRVYFRSLIVQ